MNAKINFDKVNQNAEALKEIANQLKTIQSDLSGVEQRLGTLKSDSLTKIRRSIAVQRGRIELSRKKVEGLGTSLTSIAEKYREAEENLFEEEPDLENWIKEGIEGIIEVLKKEEEPKAVSRQDKIDVIKAFEKEHLMDAGRINNFLRSGDSDDLTEDDIINILYIAYTAEEPYRSIYLKTVSRYKINTTNSGGTAYYQPWAHKVTYDYPDCFAEDPRGPYTTFFHECGHAIDDLGDRSKWIGSDTEAFKSYSDAMGKKVTLREAIEYDVYYNTANEHSITSISNKIISEGRLGSRGNTERVINAFRTGDVKSLNKEDSLLYNRVKNEYMRTTGDGALYEAVSDVYGGMTHNELRTGYGHDEPYWDDKNMAGAELWAEYFSYHMTGNEGSLGKLEEYFPEAAKVMDQYTLSLMALTLL